MTDGLIPGVLPVQRPVKPPTTPSAVATVAATSAMSTAQFAVPSVAPTVGMAQTQAAIIQKLLQSGYVFGRLPTDDQQQQPFVVSGAGMQPLQLVTLGPAAVTTGGSDTKRVSVQTQPVAVKSEPCPVTVNHVSEASAAVAGLLHTAVIEEKDSVQSSSAGLLASIQNSMAEGNSTNVTTAALLKQVSFIVYANVSSIGSIKVC